MNLTMFNWGYLKKWAVICQKTQDLSATTNVIIDQVRKHPLRFAGRSHFAQAIGDQLVLDFGRIGVLGFVSQGV